MSEENVEADSIPAAEEETLVPQGQPLDRIFNLWSLDVFRAGSLLSSSFELVSATLGAGCLALPYATAMTGVGFCVIFLFLAAAVAFYSMHLLVVVRDLHPGIGSSYEDLVFGIFGRRAQLFVEINIIIFAMGTMVAYTIVVGDTLTPIASWWFGKHSWLAKKPLIEAVTTTTIMLPLAAQKNVSALRFTSLLGILFLLYLVVAITVRTSLEFEASDWDHIKVFNFSSEIFLGIPIIMFAFASHVNIFSIYEELERPSPRRINMVVAITVVLALVFYLGIGVAGYLGYPVATQGNILKHFTIDDLFLQLASIALTVTVMLNYPLSSHPCRITLTYLIFKHGPLRNVTEPTRYWCLTFGMVYVGLAIAIFVPGVEVAFELLGATATAVCCYIMPAMLNLYGGPYASNTFHNKNIPSILIIAFGALVATASSATIIYSFTK